MVHIQIAIKHLTVNKPKSNINIRNAIIKFALDVRKILNLNLVIKLFTLIF